MKTSPPRNWELRAALAYIETLETNATRLEAQVRDQANEIARLRDKLHDLRNELHDLGNKAQHAIARECLPIIEENMQLKAKLAALRTEKKETE
jgi:phage shock protein A